MKESISCGGIVIYRGKILCLYKNTGERYKGWVLPKGTMEEGETKEMTAVREVKEESGSTAEIIKYIGETSYKFKVGNEEITKYVHWFLMQTDSFYSKPQREEFFLDSGFYKLHEAYNLLKYDNERDILEKAYDEYKKIKQSGQWNDK